MEKIRVKGQDYSPETNIYALFDSVAGSNVQYFDSCNDETAIRLVQQLAKNPNSFLYQHRKDLQLYRLFEYVPSGESVLNRTMIYSLTALPEYDETPFGLDKIQSILTNLQSEVSDFKKYIKLNEMVEASNNRLKKQGNVSFVDKLFGKHNKK